MKSGSSSRVLWRLCLVPALILLAFGAVVGHPAIPAHAATTLYDQLDSDSGQIPVGAPVWIYESAAAGVTITMT
jgi:hypothetical protein